MFRWLLKITFFREVWEFHRWKKREIFIAHKLKQENKKNQHLTKVRNSHS